MRKEYDSISITDKNTTKAEKTVDITGFKQDSAQKSRDYTISMADNTDDNGFSVRFSQNMVISDFSRLIKMFAGAPMDISYTADNQILLSFQD